jgi:hypothetical protein
MQRSYVKEVFGSLAKFERVLEPAVATTTTALIKGFLNVRDPLVSFALVAFA